MLHATNDNSVESELIYAISLLRFNFSTNNHIITE